MLVQTDISALRNSKWHDYAIRFVFGGLITAIAGLIAKHYGPVVGGLFLAFPAIFPASVTLCYKKELEKKQQKGLRGERRASSAAASESAGAVLGSIGLACFAFLCASTATHLEPRLVLLLAMLAWALVSAICWFARKRMNRLRQKPHRAQAPVPPHRF